MYFENEEEKGKTVQDYVHMYFEAAGEVETCTKAIVLNWLMND